MKWIKSEDKTLQASEKAIAQIAFLVIRKVKNEQGKQMQTSLGDPFFELNYVREEEGKLYTEDNEYLDIEDVAYWLQITWPEDFI